MRSWRAEGDLTHDGPPRQAGAGVESRSPAATWRGGSRRCRTSAPADGAQLLERLQNALAVLTAAQYCPRRAQRARRARSGGRARSPTRSRSSSRPQMWPKPQLRRLLGQRLDASVTMAFFAALRRIAPRQPRRVAERAARATCSSGTAAKRVTLLVALLALSALAAPRAARSSAAIPAPPSRRAAGGAGRRRHDRTWRRPPCAAGAVPRSASPFFGLRAGRSVHARSSAARCRIPAAASRC